MTDIVPRVAGRGMDRRHILACGAILPIVTACSPKAAITAEKVVEAVKAVAPDGTVTAIKDSVGFVGKLFSFVADFIQIKDGVDRWADSTAAKPTDQAASASVEASLPPAAQSSAPESTQIQIYCESHEPRFGAVLYNNTDSDISDQYVTFILYDLSGDSGMLSVPYPIPIMVPAHGQITLGSKEDPIVFSLPAKPFDGRVVLQADNDLQADPLEFKVVDDATFESMSMKSLNG